MPNRILREGILTSQRIAKLDGWAAEVFYRRLMSVVDDYGRYYAECGLLRAACYPRQLNKVSDSDIGKWLTVCVTAALVRVYPASDGERYLQLLDFRQQARATKSRFPEPDSTCAADATHTDSTGKADAPVFVFVDEGVCERVGERAKPARGARLPPDWSPGDEGIDFAGRQGLVNGRAQDELSKFRDYWTAQPGQKGVKVDWLATWRNWVRRASENTGKPKAGDIFEGAV